MRPVLAPRSARTRGRGRLPIAAVLLALTLPAAVALPAAAASPAPSPAPSAAPSAVPDTSGAPDASAGTCFLVPPSDPASPAPVPTAAPGASPLPERQGTIPAAGGRLTPGATYSDWSMGPTISFTAGDCWAATPVDAGYGLALVWGGSAVPSVLSVTEFTGLVFEDPCLATTDNTLPVDATPEGLIADLGQSPYLIVSEPVEADLGGLPALRIEVATQSPMGCEPPATWIWAARPSGGFVLEDGEQATFLLAQLNDRTLVVSWESYPGGDFEGLTAAAEALVATLTVDASTDDPNATFEPRASSPPFVAPGATPEPAPIA